MRFTCLCLLLFARVAHGDSTSWTRVWEGATEKLATHWTMPSLDARADRTELAASLAISVGSITELSASDVTLELRAGAVRLVCAADSMSWTETLAITAQAGAHCQNPKKLVPTALVATVKGVVHTFPITLTTPRP